MRKGIQRMFGRIADTYELVNHIMTLGMDAIWRRRTARIAAGKGTVWLDVCTGTADMAINLRKYAHDNVIIIAIDFCLPMLRKAIRKPAAKGITFILADASALPFHDEVFDVVTISFATRNIYTTHSALLNCLREFQRVLRRGGKFVNLETSQPSSRLVRRLFHFYVQVVVRRLGAAISGDRAAYQYLSRTIVHFFSADEFANILRDVGFSRVTVMPMLSGVVAIHMAVR